MADKVLAFPGQKIRSWNEISRLIADEIGDSLISEYVLDRMQKDFESSWFEIHIDSELSRYPSFNDLVERYKSSNSRLMISLACAYVELYKAGLGFQR